MAPHSADRPKRGSETHSAALLYALLGGVLIDTPGRREIGVWAAGSLGLAETFEDIAALTLNCRFSDYEQESEPRCAVRKAMEEKTLTADRFESFRRLRLEGQRVEGAAETRVRSDDARKWHIASKALRAHYKKKGGCEECVCSALKKFLAKRSRVW